VAIGRFSESQTQHRKQNRWESERRGEGTTCPIGILEGGDQSTGVRGGVCEEGWDGRNV
jgi:hypothetical protein